jgi:RNA polymerase sigma-70 factor (sigma-E family)
VSGTFEEFVAWRGAALLRFAYVLSQDSGRAEDLVQDALVKVHRRWESVIAADQPEAYVRRILVNEFLNWRRRRSSAEVAGAVPDVAVGDDLDRIAERDRMWRALAVLPPRQRAALVLRYYEDLSDAEIAAILDCAPGTVRSLTARGLAALRLGHNTTALREP